MLVIDRTNWRQVTLCGCVNIPSCTHSSLISCSSSCSTNQTTSSTWRPATLPRSDSNTTNLSEMKLNYASIYSTTTILLCSVILHKCRIWCNFCIFIITVDSLAICHSCERGGGGLIANYMNFGVYLRCWNVAVDYVQRCNQGSNWTGTAFLFSF